MSPRRRDPLVAAIFVGRDTEKRTFDRAISQIPRNGCALKVWHGVGGQGKSMLARELFRLCAPEHDPSYRHLRRAFVDLRGRSKADPDQLLVWLRNAFAWAGVKTPAFDLAFAIMWQKTRGDEVLPVFDNAWLLRVPGSRQDAPSDTIAITQEFIADTAQTVPGLGFLLKRGITWVFDRGKLSWLLRTRGQLSALYRDGQLIEDHEISELMPWMLAQDLNHHLGDNPEDRFVLFLDEYERVWDGAGTGKRWQENVFDQRLREFVAETNGLLAAFFSREPLRWQEHSDWVEVLQGNQHPLQGIGDRDADDWLRQVPVPDHEVRAAMIAGARESRDPGAPVYPLLLDLQVRHWRHLGSRASAEDFRVDSGDLQARKRELVGRLMRDYGEPVENVFKRLAPMHRFDRQTFEHIVRTWNIPLAFDYFDRIADLSLFMQGEDGWLALHRAIADVIVEVTPGDERSSTRQTLIEYLQGRANPEYPKDVTRDTASCLQEVAHLRRQEGIEGYAEWLEAAGEIIETTSQLPVLTTLWRDALDHCQAAFLDAHPDTARCLNNLASSLMRQARYDEAEPLLRTALKVRQEQLGENTYETGESYNNLGLCLRYLGHAKEAEPLLRQGLRTLQETLDPNHPHIATAYNNVASCLKDQGRAHEAEALNQKAVEHLTETLGKEHHQTASAQSNLAHCLTKLERHGEAEALYRDALEIEIAALGAANPFTAMTQSNLAMSRYVQGFFTDAEQICRQALAARREALGETHPATGSSYNDLALCLIQLGQVPEAENLLRKAVDINVTALGHSHPETATTLNNLAYCYDHQHLFEAAEPLYRRCLQVRRRKLGESHPLTGDIYTNLAGNVANQGRHSEAEALLREVLEIRSKGNDLLKTASAYEDLGACIHIIGRPQEADDLYRKAAAIRGEGDKTEQ